MSDPTRQDLRIGYTVTNTDSYTMPPYKATRRVTDAEFDALAREQGYVKPTDIMTWNEYLEFQAKANGWVKVWEDCPMCFGSGCHQDRVDCPNDECCPDCGGSGKVPAEGVPKYWAQRLDVLRGERR